MTPEETKEIVINMIVLVTKLGGGQITFEQAEAKFDHAAKANACRGCAVREQFERECG